MEVTSKQQAPRKRGFLYCASKLANSVNNHKSVLALLQAVLYTTVMALVEMKNGNRRVVSSTVGEKLWKAMRAPDELDDKQKQYVDSIKTIILNWRTAPDDYIEENLHWIVPLALHEWKVDGRGKPSQPDTEAAWQFAKKWRLWIAGGPSELARHPEQMKQATLAGSLEISR